MKRIGVATFTRAEYGCFQPVLREIQRRPGLEMMLYVGGMHLLPEFGATIGEIEHDGFPVHAKIAMPLAGDSPESVTKFVASGMNEFACAFSANVPDVLMLVGDRSELIAPALAATVFRVPLAHISGGEITEGAIDNQVRHAVSKMSHLHFVAMQECADRLVQMGEEEWRIFVTGDPALDSIGAENMMSRAELEIALNLSLVSPVIVVTYHPATLGGLVEVDALLRALANQEGTLIITHPNADAGHRAILKKMEDFVDSRPSARLVQSLGQRRYYSLLAQADLMIGNSSSGIWEAPSFKLPVVNVGDRQQGRHRSANVLDVPAESVAICEAMTRALAPAFRADLANCVNPYGDGLAAMRIVDVLERTPAGPALLKKKFVDSVCAQRRGERHELGSRMGECV